MLNLQSTALNAFVQQRNSCASHSIEKLEGIDRNCERKRSLDTRRLRLPPDSSLVLGDPMSAEV
jgi:hypothetical protein